MPYIIKINLHILCAGIQAFAEIFQKGVKGGLDFLFFSIKLIYTFFTIIHIYSISH